jgi:hypothetical protein
MNSSRKGGKAKNIALSASRIFSINLYLYFRNTLLRLFLERIYFNTELDIKNVIPQHLPLSLAMLEDDNVHVLRCKQLTINAKTF